MQDKLFQAPIPGQSLTDTPKNYPWERPPEITDPRKAIKFHMDGINKQESLDNITKMLRLGVSVNALKETILTAAQMEGIHTVDISLIIGDIVAEELISVAEEAGIDYKTGNERSETELAQQEEEMVAALLRKELSKIEGTKEDDAGAELMRQTASALESGMDESPMNEPEEPMAIEQQETDEQQEMPRSAPAGMGLMSRG